MAPKGFLESFGKRFWKAGGLETHDMYPLGATSDMSYSCLATVHTELPGLC